MTGAGDGGPVRGRAAAGDGGPVRGWAEAGDGGPLPGRTEAGDGRPVRGRGLLRWLPLAALVAIAAVALGVGAGRPSHQTLQQQAASIASQVKCPVCAGETAEESDTAAAADVRTYIRTALKQGQSRQQIFQHLEAAYGPGILEKPPANGANLVLWAGPAAAAVVAAGGLVLVFRRWRLARARAVSEADRLLVGGALSTAGPGPGAGGSPGEGRR